MNIFVLDENPVTAARMQCNRHVVKMAMESYQILSTVLMSMLYSNVAAELRLASGAPKGRGGFKFALHARGVKTATIMVAPMDAKSSQRQCIIWASSSLNHLKWLVLHNEAQLEEYTLRYNKRHEIHDRFVIMKSVLEDLLGEFKVEDAVMGTTHFAIDFHATRWRQETVDDYYNERLTWMPKKRLFWATSPEAAFTARTRFDLTGIAKHGPLPEGAEIIREATPGLFEIYVREFPKPYLARKQVAVQAYRNYYIDHKKELLVYTNRPVPDWLVASGATVVSKADPFELVNIYKDGGLRATLERKKFRTDISCFEYANALN